MKNETRLFNEDLIVFRAMLCYVEPNEVKPSPSLVIAEDITEALALAIDYYEGDDMGILVVGIEKVDYAISYEAPTP